MKLRIYSDIHLELPGATFVVPELPDDKETVLVLAGDIDTGHNATDFIKPLLRQFRAVIYVLGNHEFYGNRVDKVQRRWKATNEYHDNLHVLDDAVVVIDDVRFIGSTLWTDMDRGNPLAEMDAQQYLNDYRRITINDYGRYRSCVRWTRARCTPGLGFSFRKDCVKALMARPLLLRTMPHWHNAYMSGIGVIL